MIESKSKHIQDDGVSIAIVRTPTNYTSKAIISKIGKTNADYSVANKRMINCLLGSNLATGEIVTAGSESYLTVVSRKEMVQGQEISIIAHGLLCNATMTVTRSVDAYDEEGNPIGPTATTVINAMPCRANQITARMRQEDPGLLSTTVLKVYAQYNSAARLLDKVSLGAYSVVMQPPSFVAYGEYRLDAIDRLEIPGCMVLQLSAWMG